MRGQLPISALPRKEDVARVLGCPSSATSGHPIKRTSIILIAKRADLRRNGSINEVKIELEHSPIFFGRTRARNELRELLNRQVERCSAFVLVVGASGAGESSAVKAGRGAGLFQI